MRQSLIIFLTALLLAGCNLEGATPIPPTPDIPSVQFLFPENNQQVFEFTDLTLDVYAEDDTMGITMIDLFVDGELVHTAMPEVSGATQFRAEMNWLASGVGFHPISVIAYREDQTRSDEALIIVEVIATGDSASTPPAPQSTEEAGN